MTTQLVMKQFSHLGRMPVESEEHEQKLIAKNAALAAEDNAPAKHLHLVDLQSDDDVILSDARRHLAEASLLPLPVVVVDESVDSRWKSWSDAMEARALEFGTCIEAIRYAQSSIPFDHREKMNLEKCKDYSLFVEFEFPWLRDFARSFSESLFSVPDTLGTVNDRAVSNIFFWHLRAMLFCQTMTNSPKRILELGGGYGALARLWLLNKRVNVERYVIADLPEALFFSEVFLRKEFGDQIGYWEGSDPGTKVVLVPVSRLHEYKSRSDLVINIGSMQEMSDDWVTHYMKWLDDYDVRFFYSLNYGGQPLVSMYESRTFWAPRPSQAWTARIVNTDVPIVELMCLGRDFAEILYEKAPSTRTLRDWSVLSGAFLTRQTYFEGLELLRQQFTIGYGIKFLTVVMSTFGDEKKVRFLPPKELLPLVHSLIATGDKQAVEFASPLAKYLEKMIGNISA